MKEQYLELVEQALESNHLETLTDIRGVLSEAVTEGLNPELSNECSEFLELVEDKINDLV